MANIMGFPQESEAQSYLPGVCVLQEELGFSCSGGQRCQGFGADLALVLLVGSSALTRGELEGSWKWEMAKVPCALG